MSETTGNAIDWAKVRKTRWAYRLLFLLVIGVIETAQLAGVSESDAGRFSRANALVMAAGFMYAVFLYFFLETGRLMGYRSSRLLGVALFALFPVVNIPAIVIEEIWRGTTLARRRRELATAIHTTAEERDTANADTQGMSRPVCAPLLARLLIALPVGVAVFILTCYAGFHEFRGHTYVQRAGRFTLRYVADVQRAIETYRQETGRLPESLRDVSFADDANLPTDETGLPLDDWHRPLRYATDGSTYRVTSYGRDGRPGGLGLDFDLSTSDLPEGGVDEHGLPPLPPQAKATFQQFVGDQGKFGRAGSGFQVFLTSIWAGVVGFVLGLVLPRTRQRARRGVLDTLLQLVITVGVAAFVGLIMTTLHQPVGH